MKRNEGSWKWSNVLSGNSLKKCLRADLRKLTNGRNCCDILTTFSSLIYVLIRKWYEGDICLLCEAVCSLSGNRGREQSGKNACHSSVQIHSEMQRIPVPVLHLWRLCLSGNHVEGGMKYYFCVHVLPLPGSLVREGCHSLQMRVYCIFSRVGSLIAWCAVH